MYMSRMCALVFREWMDLYEREIRLYINFACYAWRQQRGKWKVWHSFSEFLTAWNVSFAELPVWGLSSTFCHHEENIWYISTAIPDIDKKCESLRGPGYPPIGVIQPRAKIKYYLFPFASNIHLKQWAGFQSQSRFERICSPQERLAAHLAL